MPSKAAVKEATKKFTDLKKKIADAQKDLQVAAQVFFKELSVELFNENPTLVEFSWSQYTPYWNDGEPCTFSANTSYPSVTISAEDGNKVKYDENMGEMVIFDKEDDEIEYAEEDHDKYEKEIEKVSTQVTDFLEKFGDSDMEVMFGDHVEVIVKRGGIVDTEQYDHE